MRVFLDAVNQSGLWVTVCSAASLAASTICFPKSGISALLDDSMAVLGSKFLKNLDAVSWNLLF